MSGFSRTPGFLQVAADGGSLTVTDVPAGVVSLENVPLSSAARSASAFNTASRRSRPPSSTIRNSTLPAAERSPR